MAKRESYWNIVWMSFRRNRLAMVGLFVVLALFVVAIFAPFIANSKPIVLKLQGKWYAPAVHLPVPFRGTDFKLLKDTDPDAYMVMAPIPFSPNDYNLDEILTGPSKKHLLGTDDQGRDVASQLIYGSRISLSIGFVAVSIYVIIGIIIGALAGYYGGWVDLVISRFIEIMMCFPTFFLILAVLAFIGPSIYNIMIVIGLTSWTGVARLIRGEFLKLRSQEFVIASEATGAKDRRVIFRHLLPNSLAPVLVSATFGVASAILVESGLSFLGFGVPPYVASWGGLLSQSRDFLDIAWWLTLSPGFAIFITITAYNLVGEGLRDAIDPRLRI
jgi:peptide/nickel transport system permease protein